MEPVNNQDVLIRLLKEGHISENEFKSLYSEETVFIPWNQTDEILNPQPFIHLYDPTNGPFYTTN